MAMTTGGDAAAMKTGGKAPKGHKKVEAAKHQGPSPVPAHGSAYADGGTAGSGHPGGMGHGGHVPPHKKAGA
jgi:hypothetical protein